MTEKRLPKPESLEAKLMLLCRLPYDRRAKRKHCLVFGFILDWYHDKYGNALASVRHIAATLKERDPAGNGLYLGDVHTALTDLVEWGYLQQDKGAGRKASRYVPAWNLVCVRENANATGDDPSVRENANTCVRENANATAVSVREITNEDPLTGPGHRTGSHVMGNEFETAPVAPLTVGLEATVADTASGDGFSEFWKAWPRKHGIKKARAEWRKISGETADIISAAAAWAAHYREHGTDKKWIPEPANWLAGERWLEDLPIIHGDAKGAAIAKAKANAPTKAKASPSNDNAKAQSEPVRIIAIEESGDPFGEWGIRLTVDDDFFKVQTFDLAVYKSGGNAADYDVYRQLLDVAYGIQSDLLGRRIHVATDGNRLNGVSAAKPAARYVQIAEADSADGKTVSAVLEDINYKPEGRLDLDWGQVLALCKVLGITDIRDTDELLFKDFVIDERGEFVSVEEFERMQEENEKEAA